MSMEGQITANDYRVETLPVEGEVVAYHGNAVLAASTRATVLYETRLPPTTYFPQADVSAELTPVPGTRTFCPFKGTAIYYDVTVGDVTIPKGAWSYPDALPEAQALAGQICFAPKARSRLDYRGAEPLPTASGNITGPTVDWLLREAWQCRTPAQLAAALGKRLRNDGVAVSRLSILVWSLHPMIAGHNYVWRPGQEGVRTKTASYDLLDQPAYINSPLRHVAHGLGGVRQRLTGAAEFEFPIMAALKEEGATDYVAMPLVFSNGQINVMTLSCDHRDGFTTANLGLIFECLAVLSRYFEIFSLKDTAATLLETYVGKRTGARVLNGDIRRGDGDEIDAAILFCDLRHSTRLEVELGRRAYLDLLNCFFEATSDIVSEHEGEILKFLGDATLAIFPASQGDLGRPRRQALAAARDIVGRLGGGGPDALDCAIGIAFGNVTYGNIGSRERLDFTVIGAAANIAARLADAAKLAEHSIVMTEDIADTAPDLSTPLGHLDLRNVARPIAAFTVTAAAIPPTPTVKDGSTSLAPLEWGDSPVAG